MNWYRVIWTKAEFTEQPQSELIWSSEDRIHDDLADLKKVEKSDIVIQDITKFDILIGGNC